MYTPPGNLFYTGVYARALPLPRFHGGGGSAIAAGGAHAGGGRRMADGGPARQDGDVTMLQGMRVSVGASGLHIS